MSARSEYRVRWRREGGRISTRIVQTRPAARRKYLAVLGVERLRDVVRGLRHFPALSEGPVIQQREVGEWEDTDEAPELTDRKLAELQEWAEYRYPEEPPVHYGDEHRPGDSGRYDGEIGF